jgi:hypothetical protein
MRYCIVTNMAQTRTDCADIAALRGYVEANGLRFSGVHRSKHTRAELQGQPIIEGFHGPAWGGDGIVRYEDWESCDLLSRD